MKPYTLLLVLFIILNQAFCQDNQTLTLISEINALKSELDRLKEEYKSKTSEIEKERERLKVELSLKETEIQSKLKLIEDYEKALKQKEILINDSQLSNESKQLALNSKEQEISSFRDKVAAKEDVISSKNVTIQTLEKRIIDKESTLKDKELIIEEKQKSILDKQKMVDEKQRRIDDKDSEIQRLNGELLNATSKRRFVRVIQGAGIYGFRTPEYNLAPQSASNLGTLVISNENSGSGEADLMAGFAVMAIDFNKSDIDQTLSCGPFIGFGGRDLFRNFYLGWDFKIYMIHLNVGFNFHEFNILRSGFKEGDVLPAGQSIPTTREWKLFQPYLGICIDSEFVKDIFGKKK